MRTDRNVWGMSMTVDTLWFSNKREMKWVPIIVNLRHVATYVVTRSAEIFLSLGKGVQDMTGLTPSLYAAVIISVIRESRNPVHRGPQHMQI